MTSGQPLDVETLLNRIQNSRTAVHDSTTDGERMDARKKLADALIADHEVTHSSESIEEAIAIYDGVLQHKPPDHEQRAGAVSDLGDALYRACVYHQADPTRSRRCFELLREGLQLRPQGHAARSYSLDSLAQALLWVDDDKHAGDRLGACAESILLSREALQLRPDGHAERARSLGNLAIGLMRSFDHGRDLNVLAEALDLLRENLRLRPPGHPRRDASLNNLAVTLLYSFQEQGGFATLAELIDMHRQVLLLRPLGHPLRYTTLDNLAVAIRTSFTLQGSPQLLSEAIALHREAVDVIPEAHPDRGRIVCNLAEALVREFEQDGSLAVLDESITLLRGALRSPTNDGAEYFRLAKALLARFDVDKDRGHLTEAAALHREALKLCEPDSINRLESLRSFGCLLCRSECQSWVEALVLFREAVEMCPYGSSGRARLLSDLSQCFLNPESQLFDFSEGLSLVSEAHSDTFSHVNWRLRLASLNMQRVEIAYEHVLGKDLTLDSKRNFSRRVLELYAQVISLLPRAANFGLDHDARLHAIAGSDRLVRDAAARALRLDDISQAVEMLEEGRSIFWTQTLHLRASAFDGVPDEDHTELVRLLNLLEHGASRVYASKQTVTQRERDLEARRKLNEQAEALIIRIRGYAGLGRFLLPPAFETLLGALPDGYVVIVNASHIGHHALLLNRVAGLASNVELNPPRVDFDPIALRAQLPRDLKLHAAEMANRAMRLVARTHDNLDEVLNDLWTSIVLPILNHLRLEKDIGRARPRLWWCVTGGMAFLPIHAAGAYQVASSQCTSDYVVSSYIPTLSSLTKARSSWKSIERAQVAGLIICEDASGPDTTRHLPQAVVEVQAVREYFVASEAQILNAHSVHTSPSELRSILEGTPTHILHLACHATQEPDPLRSAFLLKDGALTIQDIIQMNLPHAMLAYLSACQTAKGDRNAPDEAVHLAASMLFCGFRSVVGTMWLMHDEDGPRLAQRFYEGLFAKESLELDDVPYALDEAIRSLRNEGVPARRWALFMHMGG